MGPAPSSPGVKRSGYEADMASFSAEAKNERKYICTVPYAVMLAQAQFTS
jgi:hypothetical protein